MDELGQTPVFRISFVLTKIDTEDFNRTEVSKRINLIPSNTSGPVMSKGKFVCSPEIQEGSNDFIGLTILPSSQAPYPIMKHAYWEISLPEIACWTFEEALSQFVSLLQDKSGEIIKICEDFDLRADFLVRVFGELNYMPEIRLTPKSLTFLASINSSIEFAFYVD